MPIIVEYANRFGVYDNLMPVLSMALGAGETTLLRMVTGYSMLDNGGKQIKATFIDRIQDRYGRTIWRHDGRDCSACAAREWSGQQEPELIDDRKQVIDPMSAFQMVNIMEGVVQSGTAQKLKVLKRPIAGKTGTTNDYKDAWFIGFTPDLAVGVYIGFDQPSSLGHGETGGNVAAPVVRDFMREALARCAPGAVPRAARHQARARQPQDRPAGGPRRQDRHHGGVQAWSGACWLGGRGRRRGGRRDGGGRFRPAAAARAGRRRRRPSAGQRPCFDIGYRRPLLDPIFS